MTHADDYLSTPPLVKQPQLLPGWITFTRAKDGKRSGMRREDIRSYGEIAVGVKYAPGEPPPEAAQCVVSTIGDNYFYVRDTFDEITAKLSAP